MGPENQPRGIEARTPFSRLIMDFWDPHFHLWHPSMAVWAGPAEGPSAYTLSQYEDDLSRSGMRPVGGAWVEAASACTSPMDSSGYATACLAEADWAGIELGGSPRTYRRVAAVSLQDPEISSMLAILSAQPDLVGVRQILNHKPSWPRNRALQDLLQNPDWRRGYAALQEYGLSFDMQLNPHQLQAAADLIEQCDRVPVMIDHLGTPTLYDCRHGDAYWPGLRRLAELPQVRMKISMLSYIDSDWDLIRTSLISDSIHRIIEMFGEARCCFASNFPVEKTRGWLAPRLFSAYRDLAAGYPPAEQAMMFSGTARGFYVGPT